MFTSNTPDDDGLSNDGTSALSGSGSLRIGKSSVGSPPKLEMPASMELGSDTLVSFREMSEQAIQGMLGSAISKDMILTIRRCWGEV